MNTHLDTSRSQKSASAHPIERILPLLKKVRELPGDGRYSACCPAHGDSEASLSLWKDGTDHVGIMCHAGCSHDAIIAAMNLTWRDLYRENTVRDLPEGGISLADLASDKIIHPTFLHNLGCRESTHQGKRAVLIPYRDGEGGEVRMRVRSALKATNGSAWLPGEALYAYGLDRLEDAHKAGYLVIVEGESDCWTLWQRGLPALGVPGVQNYKVLGFSMVKDLDRIYISQEPPSEKDLTTGKNPGLRFVENVKKHLTTLGYKGKMYALDLQTSHGVKDPNELHKRDVKGFKAAFEQALQQARPLFKERKKPTIARLCDLQQEQLPETKWAIDPILPEGVTILGGKPKLGKSWLALALMAAIASGGAALGQYPVERGEVLYISLEDNKKRLQKRTNTFLSRVSASPDFYYATSWERIDQGGLDDLREWIDEHPRARLICIDTWARFKPKLVGSRGHQYDEDYDALQPLQSLAGEKGVSILVIDHMRKMESEDPLDMISGSVGKTGAVDGFLLLYRKRGETDARLFVIGRDIEEEQELLLTFDQHCASWTVKGNATDTTIASTPERQAILDLLLISEQSLSARSIAERLDRNIHTIRELLKRLRAEEKITLQNNAYSVVRRSQDSQRSQRSQRSQGEQESLTMSESGLTTPDYGNYESVVRATFAESEPVASSEHADNESLTTLTTVTMQKCIRAYGEANGYPSLKLSNGVDIPEGLKAWNGFLRYREEHLQRAYDDICAHKAVILR